MSEPVDYHARAEAYARAHAGLSLASIDALVDLCSEDVVFHDPFNDTIGKTELRHLLLDMFKLLDNPRTEITGLFGGRRRWIVKWRFQARGKAVGALDVVGLTELTLAEDGRVAAHLDYWDAGAAVYGRLPLLGPIVRMVRKRIAAKSRL